MSLLRTRDFLAVLVAVILTRMAWRDSFESITATMILAFYIPTHGDEGGSNQMPIAPAVLDVDVDGTAEALAVVASHGHDQWKIQIIDLKAGMMNQLQQQQLATGGAPFRPQVLLESEPIQIQASDLPFHLNKDGTAHTHNELTTADPVAIVTGHVMFQETEDDKSHLASPSSSSKTAELDVNERSRHFFCGTDWHDASSRCGHPCPGGRQEECSEGERCFADTPCDYHEHHANKRKHQAHQVHSGWTTPSGSVPSIATLWENGMVTLHSITAEKDNDNSTATSSSSSKKKSKSPALELRRMWTSKPLQNHTLSGWETHKLEFLDAVTSDHAHGMILLTAVAMVAAESEDDQAEEFHIPCVVAMDAKTGDVLWETLSEHPELNANAEYEQEQMLLPLLKGTSSLARRRSFKPSSTLSRIVANNFGKTDSHEMRLGMMEANCMHSFRRSMLTSGALPFLQWSESDVSSRALHFEHQPTPHDPHYNNKKQNSIHNKRSKVLHQASASNHASLHGGGGIIDKTTAALASERKLAQQHGGGGGRGVHHAAAVNSNQQQGTKSITGLAKKLSTSWLPGSNKNTRNHQHRYDPLTEPKFGRPNVVVTHHKSKLQVRSLKNGRSLCHLTLWQETLYADLNHDGILDSVTVVTGERSLEDDDEVDVSRRWIAQLVKRVQGIDKGDKEKNEEVNKELKEQKFAGADLCHVQVLSGVPAKEELFSVDICGLPRDQPPGGSNVNDLYSAPPLVVEPLRGKGKDLVVALSSGVVTRVEGVTGQKQWQWAGARHRGADFTTWSDDAVALLTRIDSPNVIHSTRPILITGENGMTLLSARQGKFLASAAFAQVPYHRPLILDLNGDGTSDVLVMTTDAMWGYFVRVRTGGSYMFRTIVGLVLMGLMLAVLRNRFGPQPGKRSTDA